METPGAAGKGTTLEKGVNPACLNAIEHGNRLDPAKAYEVELEWEEGILTIRVYDHGGTPWDGTLRNSDIAHVMDGKGDPRGWGLRIIDALADTWTFRTHGDRAGFEIKVRL